MKRIVMITGLVLLANLTFAQQGKITGGEKKTTTQSKVNRDGGSTGSKVTVQPESNQTSTQTSTSTKLSRDPQPGTEQNSNMNSNMERTNNKMNRTVAPGSTEGTINTEGINSTSPERKPVRVDDDNKQDERGKGQSYEKRMKVEERSNGNAFSGRGNGGRKNLVDPVSKDNKGGSKNKDASLKNQK